MAEATERSVSQLFAELPRDMGMLIRKELELAQLEMGQKASLVTRQMVFVAVGGAVAYGGLLALIAALVLVLAERGLQPWVSALIAGTLVLAIGGFLVQRGVAVLRRTDLVPRETIRTVRETAEWAKNPTP